jgi:hypothetical protein
MGREHVGLSTSIWMLSTHRSSSATIRISAVNRSPWADSAGGEARAGRRTAESGALPFTREKGPQLKAAAQV